MIFPLKLAWEHIDLSLVIAKFRGKIVFVLITALINSKWECCFPRSFSLSNGSWCENRSRLPALDRQSKNIYSIYWKISVNILLLLETFMLLQLLIRHFLLFMLEVLSLKVMQLLPHIMYLHTYSHVLGFCCQIAFTSLFGKTSRLRIGLTW